MTRSTILGLAGAALLFFGCGEKEAPDEVREAVAHAPATPAATPGRPAREEAAPTANPSFTCNAIERNHLCFTVAPLPMLTTGVRSGCEVGSGGQWSEGESCPTDDVVGTCRKEQNREARYFYRGANLERAETACTSFGGAWEAS